MGGLNKRHMSTSLLVLSASLHFQVCDFERTEFWGLISAYGWSCTFSFSHYDRHPTRLGTMLMDGTKMHLSFTHMV